MNALKNDRQAHMALLLKPEENTPFDVAADLERCRQARERLDSLRRPGFVTRLARKLRGSK